MMNNQKGKIILIPSMLGDSADDFYNDRSRHLIHDLDFFIVENERSARRFLRRIGYGKSFDAVTMLPAADDAGFAATPSLAAHLEEGKNIGVISEAGCPGIADPGRAVARWAHDHDVAVHPLIGPSSVFLALMASGLNGQCFAFHGYLPVKGGERKKRLQLLEEASRRKGQTQLFIETPYRNNSLLHDILETCSPGVLLCVASNITLPDEMIRTQRISDWKHSIPQLNKQPAIFLLLAG